MAKVYTAPKEIKKPVFNFNDIAGYQKAQEQYVEDLKVLLLKRKKGKNIGETIRFQVADGYAQYMVASMKPLELVHIPLGDAYDFQYAHRLTAKDVQEKIDQQKRMNELFGRKK